MAAILQRSVQNLHFEKISKLFDVCTVCTFKHLNISHTRRLSSDESKPAEVYKQEHLEMRRTLSKIIEKDINPHVDEWEEKRQFPAHAVFKKLGEAGLLGVTKPVEYGGLGLDYTFSLALAEELGTVKCGGIPMAIGVQTDMATPALAKFGSDELRKEFLAPAISGDMVTCIGVSEPTAGSDVAGIHTKAVKDGDDYVINGGKMWISNGFQADWMCCLVNTGDGPVHKNKSLIIIPLDLPGVERARRISKLGMHCSDTAQIFFDNVRVPQKNLIGEEGMGFMYQMLQFQEERMFGTAAVLLAMENIIEQTIEYTRQRRAFGSNVLNFQTVHFTLAELQTEIELLRSLLYRTVCLYKDGNDVTKLASMAKLKAGRLARQVTDRCLQFWGGMGFTTEVPVSRFYRDMRLLSIGGGSDETMLSIICKYMGTLPQFPAPKK